MEELIEKLTRQGVLKTPRLIEAFLANDRKKFVPQGFEAEAYVDAPLPIGCGQTISQPYTVAFMLELLQPQEGNKVLDIGFGSGWTSGILAKVVGNAGRVYGLEIVPEVYEFGKRNLEQFNYQNLVLLNQSGASGLSEFSPFDRILVSAASLRVPSPLKMQLQRGGRLVIPVGSVYSCAIKLLTKTQDDQFEETDYPGFAFVPLVEKIKTDRGS